MRGSLITRKIKRSLLLVLALLLATPLGIDAEGGSVGGSAASACLMEAESGTVLYEKDADTRRPMASTTKIMTALVAIEENDLTRTVAVPKEAVGVEGSSVYLVANERLTMEQLLYALMLESANDAATAIAVLTAGSVEDFAVLMNRKATELGLADTAFENPHGLDGEGHYTTARDLARLTAYALKNETFRKIVSTYKQTIPLNGDQGTRVLLNHNRLLRSYEGCIGVKTGFTKRSGRCLVTAAEREGVTLVAVTLKAPDDWDDHKRMLDYGFGAVERVTLLDDSGYVGAVPTVGGVTDRLHFLAEGPVSVTLPRGERNIRTVYEHFRFYYAPITEGDVIGRMVWYDGDREIASTSLIAAETVEKRKEKKSFWQWLLSLFT
ncbi:MAG: D-alanyl-D-alanine carboxypeptidase [Clostridia bacterium]|nr:D-alanyl-D-alanine carboxypeptidase [Clostridia bacterium]